MALALSRHSSEVAAAVRHLARQDSVVLARTLKRHSLVATDVGHDVIVTVKRSPDRWAGLLTYMPELAEVYGR